MGHVKVVQSGHIIEIYRYAKSLGNHQRKGAKRATSIKKRNHRALVQRADNAKRRTRNLRRIIIANLQSGSKPAFLSLTVTGIVSTAASRLYIKDFLSRLKRQYPRVVGEIFKYIYVTEYQQRGAIHFHVLVWSLDSRAYQKERDTRDMQHLWLRGFLDCRATYGRADQIANYVAKYLSKSPRVSHSKQSDRDQNVGADEEKGQESTTNHASYIVSRNCLRPVSQSFNSSMEHIIEEHLTNGDKSLVQEREFDTLWLGRCNYQVHKIKPYGESTEKS